MQSTTSKSDTKSASGEAKKHPVFNNEFEILSSLGDGKTSKVYLCQSIKEKEKKMAMKLLREEFLQKDEKNVKAVEREI